MEPKIIYEFPRVLKFNPFEIQFIQGMLQVFKLEATRFNFARVYVESFEFTPFSNIVIIRNDYEDTRYMVKMIVATLDLYGEQATSEIMENGYHKITIKKPTL